MVNHKPSMPSQKPVTTPPFPNSAFGGGGRYGGNITAAAESMAAVLAKPGVDGSNLKGMDAMLTDLASAMEVLQGGLTARAAAMEAEMPDETSGHEQLRQLAGRMARLAVSANEMQSDQWRRNAEDHNRVGDGARRNERGYDWSANQD